MSGTGVSPSLEIPDGFLIVPHVGVIQETYQANCSGAVKEKAAGSIEFKILGRALGEISIKEDSIGYFGHHRFAEP